MYPLLSVYSPVACLVPKGIQYLYTQNRAQDVCFCLVFFVFLKSNDNDDNNVLCT